MKGHPDVIDYLKDLLRGELAARDQYFVHSRRYEDLGLHALYERIDHEMQEEAQHADALLRRILFLEGDPDMSPKSFEQGRSVEEMLKKDLALEYEVREKLAMDIALCERLGDYGSREMLRVRGAAAVAAEQQLPAVAQRIDAQRHRLLELQVQRIVCGKRLHVRQRLVEFAADHLLDRIAHAVLHAVAPPGLK